MTTMADNKENRILKSSIEREQSQTCLNSAESEKIKGSTNLNGEHRSLYFSNYKHLSFF